MTLMDVGLLSGRLLCRPHDDATETSVVCGEFQ